MTFPRPVNVPKTDTFDVWRQKMNQLSADVGDLTQLNPPLNGSTSLVEAINNISLVVANNERGILVRAMALT